MQACVLSHVQLFAAAWIVTCQAPLSMGFSRQEYWSGLLCPPPGDLPDPGIEPTSPVSPALQADSLPDKPSSGMFTTLSHSYLFLARIFKIWASPGGSMTKNLHANEGAMGSIPGLGRSAPRRKRQPTPILFPGESRG